MAHRLAMPFCLIACLLIASHSLAGTTLVADNRKMDLTTVASVDNTIDLFQYSDAPAISFSNYLNTLNETAVVNDPNNQGMADAHSTLFQNSTISTTFMDFEGFAEGDSFGNIAALGILGGGISENTNTFQVKFNLTTTESYSLNGTIEAFRSHSDVSNPPAISTVVGQASVSLVGPSSTIFSFAVNNPPPGLSHQTVINNHQGVLPPGQYTLTAVAYNASISRNTPRPSSRGAFDLEFTLTQTPEPSSLVLAVLGGLFILLRRSTYGNSRSAVAGRRALA